MFDHVEAATQDRGGVKKEVDAGVLEGGSGSALVRLAGADVQGQCQMRWYSEIQHAEAGTSQEGSVSALCAQLCSCEILSRSEPDMDCYKAY